MRQVPRPSCEGHTLPFTLTVCTLKGALMLLLKGATYLETPKHDVVLKVQAIQHAPDGRLLLRVSRTNVLVKRIARAIHPLAKAEGLVFLVLCKCSGLWLILVQEKGVL